MVLEREANSCVREMLDGNQLAMVSSETGECFLGVVGAVWWLPFETEQGEVGVSSFPVRGFVVIYSLFHAHSGFSVGLEILRAIERCAIVCTSEIMPLL